MLSRGKALFPFTLFTDLPHGKIEQIFFAQFNSGGHALLCLPYPLELSARHDRETVWARAESWSRPVTHVSRPLTKTRLQNLLESSLPLTKTLQFVQVLDWQILKAAASARRMSGARVQP